MFTVHWKVISNTNCNLRVYGIFISLLSTACHENSTSLAPQSVAHFVLTSSEVNFNFNSSVRIPRASYLVANPSPGKTYRT